MAHDFQLWVRSERIFKQAAQLFKNGLGRENYSASAANDQLISIRLITDAPETRLREGRAGGTAPSPMAFLDDDYTSLIPYSELALKTIWLNREGEISPDTVPIHDAEVRDLQELLNFEPLFKGPSLRQCLDWWDAWSVPENVRMHSKTVAWGAYVLAVMLRNRGISVDPILTHRGGLLHDIDKIKTLQVSGAHGQRGAAFLEEVGYLEVAQIVREHIMSTILNPQADDRPWEVKLVFFCDKLVEGDRIVPFNQRLDKLMARYPQYRDTMRLAEEPIWALSDQVCSRLGIASHEVMTTMLKDLKMKLSG